MTATVRDARPPIAVVRVLNPMNRLLLRTPLGRLARPLALLEFTGRRSGRGYCVPVGWHDADGAPVVVTPAPWRPNFIGGAPATVHHRGRTQPMTGTLVTDPAEVADVLMSVLAGGASPRSMGLGIPVGHTVSAADVVAVDRAVIRFVPAG